MYKSASLLLRFHLPPAAGQPPSQQRTGHTGQLPSIVWKRHHLLAIAAMQAVMHTTTNTTSYDMPKTEDPLPWPDCVMKGRRVDASMLPACHPGVAPAPPQVSHCHPVGSQLSKESMGEVSGLRSGHCTFNFFLPKKHPHWTRWTKRKYPNAQCAVWAVR